MVGDRSPPDNPVPEWVREFWAQFAETGESGEASWEVIEDLRLQVCDCLAKTPPDIERAESLTAYAAMLMQGGVF